MGGGEGIEVTTIYSSVGHGGVGNLVEAKKNENKPGPPLPKITPSVLTLDSCVQMGSWLSFRTTQIKSGPRDEVDSETSRPAKRNRPRSVSGISRHR